MDCGLLDPSGKRRHGNRVVDDVRRRRVVGDPAVGRRAAGDCRRRRTRDGGRTGDRAERRRRTPGGPGSRALRSSSVASVGTSGRHVHAVVAGAVTGGIAAGEDGRVRRQGDRRRRVGALEQRRCPRPGRRGPAVRARDHIRRRRRGRRAACRSVMSTRFRADAFDTGFLVAARCHHDKEETVQRSAEHAEPRLLCVRLRSPRFLPCSSTDGSQRARRAISWWRLSRAGDGRARRGTAR